MKQPLTGQVALITGASSGIGRAIALSLAENGVGIVLFARRRAELEAVANDVRVRSAKAYVFPGDMTHDEDIRSLREHVEREFGALDILVHCAGQIAIGTLEASQVASLDSQYSVNVRGPYLLTKELLPLLRKRLGQVVFVNSSAGIAARAASGQFSATQHALKAIADSLREELNSEGIRVLTIFPGRTATQLQEEVFRCEERPYQPNVLLQPEDIAAMVTAAVALPRTAEVTEIHIRPLKKTY
jgi:NADP-dependent 3-hydroxy acid dehydrogenase YdfG